MMKRLKDVCLFLFLPSFSFAFSAVGREIHQCDILVKLSYTFHTTDKHDVELMMIICVVILFGHTDDIILL